MEEKLQYKIDLFELKLKESVQEMSGFATKDDEKTRSYKHELEIYVN